MSGLRKLYTVTSYCWGSLFLFLPSKPSKILILALFCGTSEAVNHFRMKLNISFPATGCQKLIEVDNERKLRTFCEKHMATEVVADALGEEWKGYVARISGGNNKQGFPMKQGVLTHGQVHLLLSKGHSCYRPRRTGERKHKILYGVALWMPV